MNATEEFEYRVAGLPGGQRPGAHKSRARGAGMSFASHARLFDLPDPRRLDLRASLTTVPHTWLVRRYQQHSTFGITAIVDVSRSMYASGDQRQQMVTDFLASLAHSAYRRGDPIGLLAFDNRCQQSLSLPLQTGRQVGYRLQSHLGGWSIEQAEAGSSAGLADCLPHISPQTRLVFLLTDGHWPLQDVPAILDKLPGAMVVPIITWLDADTTIPTRGRWVSARDSETGQTRHLWMSQRVHQQWQQTIENRRIDLISTFNERGVDPVFMQNHFDADALTRYFMERVGR